MTVKPLLLKKKPENRSVADNCKIPRRITKAWKRKPKSFRERIDEEATGGTEKRKAQFSGERHVIEPVCKRFREKRKGRRKYTDIATEGKKAVKI